MAAPSTPNSLFALADRNKHADAAIRKYAWIHGGGDVIIGLLSGAVPGGGIVGTVGGIALQSVAIYQPMVRELAAIYSAVPDGSLIHLGVLASGAESIGEMLVDEFGKEFLQEILTDILQDMGLSIGLSWIPLIGKVLSAGKDYAVARALTWAVGSMAVVYFLNGEQFCGTRKETFALCKQLDLQAVRATEGCSLDDLPWKVPSVLDSMVSQLLAYVATTRAQISSNFLRKLFPISRSKPMSAKEITAALEPHHLPQRLLDEVLRRGEGKVVAASAT